MIMIVWRPHITGSRDHLNLSLQWLVSEGGVVSCTFWSRYVISLEKSTQNTFFLFLYFSRMNWIHKFQMRVFEGGQCWHECQADWRINTVNLKEIQPPCPAQCLPSNSCSILFCLFNWAVVVQKRHKMMINLLSGEFKAQRVISWFPPNNSLSVLKFHMRIAVNEICAPTLFDHRLTILCFRTLKNPSNQVCFLIYVTLDHQLIIMSVLEPILLFCFRIYVTLQLQIYE